MFERIHAKAHRVKQKIQDEVDDLQVSEIVPSRSVRY